MDSTTPLTAGLLRSGLSACEQLEADLSAYVDGALSELDHRRIAAHIKQCGGCHSFVDSLAGLTGLHGDVDAERMVEGLEHGEMWADLTRRLASDAGGRLARVLYELGKALIAAGIGSHPDTPEVTYYAKKPGSIPTLRRKGQRLAREYSRLEGQAPGTGRARSHLRSRGLFPRRDQVRGAPAFESGRACLEQCLRLDPSVLEARMYLSQYYREMGRPDRARQQLKVLMRSEPSKHLKIAATQLMGRIYAAAQQYARAIELELRVFEAAARAGETMFQVVSLTNLAIYSVKLKRFDDAEGYVSRLVREFNPHLDVVSEIFRRARGFRQILLAHPAVLAGYRERYPVLFPVL